MPNVKFGCERNLTLGISHLWVSACGKYGTHGKHLKSLVGESEKDRPRGKARRSSENNINMYLKKQDRKARSGVDYSCLGYAKRGSKLPGFILCGLLMY